MDGCQSALSDSNNFEKYQWFQFLMGFKGNIFSFKNPQNAIRIGMKTGSPLTDLSLQPDKKNSGDLYDLKALLFFQK